ncbi:hypothetical protein MRY82_08050 [bacterium]|nr:hypothetical protein [bacterium]
MNNTEKFLERFEKNSNIPRHIISKYPNIFPYKKKQDFEFFSELVKDLANFFNNREEICTKEEVKVLEKISYSNTIEIPNKNTIFARPDGFWNEYFQMIEINIGNSIGGLLAIDKLGQYYSSITENIEFNSIVEGLFHMWKPYNDQKNPIILHRNIGEHERYERQNIELVSLLKERGLNIEFSDTKKLYQQLKNNELKPSLLVTRQDILDNKESHDLIFKFEDLAKQKGFRLFCDNRNIDILNSKVLLALFREYMQSKYIVPSFWLGNVATKSLDKFRLRIESIISDKNKFMIKKDCSYQGKDVFFGDECSDAEWEKLINNAINDGVWIAQFVQSGQSFIFYDTKGSSEKEYPAVVSPYYFSGKANAVALRYRLSEQSKVCSMPGSSKTVFGMLGFKNAN